MENLPHPELQAIKTRLLQIHDGISTFTPLTARPPILDSSYDAGNENNEDNQWLQQEIVPGLKKLKENIKLDLGVLEKFLDDPNCVNLPALSTNAPYLIAVWNEVICAAPPIVSVYKTFPLQVSSSTLTHAEKVGTRQEPKTGAKVDVVADNGRQWIRVNTVKNSRMMSEFREIDSYLTDSSDDSDEEWDDVSRPTLAQKEFDNSVLRMGRTLLQAAKANPIEGTAEIPKVTLRLTRLDPHANEDGTLPDSRIGETIDRLLELGVNVELGERTDAELSAVPPPSTEDAPIPDDISFAPTSNINLDLSGLIALISDLTHASVPETPEELNRRFVPPQEYREWKQKRQDMKLKNGGKFSQSDLEDRGKSKKSNKNAGGGTQVQREGSETPELENDINDLPRDLIQHARALTNQLLQEMGQGLLQEIRDKLEMSTACPNEIINPSSSLKVVFWTTSEARERCLRIVSKIGGVHEKRRAYALFCLSPTDGSEISLEEAERLYWQGSRFTPQFIPLLPIHIFPSDAPDASSVGPNVPVRPRSGFAKALGKVCADILSQESIPRRRALPTDDIINGANSEIQRATVTKANPRLTAHTVQSMQWGAELGWTTLTANRTSVKAILRELKSAKVAGRLAGVGKGDSDADGQATAAIWIIDPRSLAEGMSSVPPVRSGQ
ncbi:hypothetical protein JR316_0013271 [Psilocybe cubensis]|uniref:Uncharacterized protein n=2 Tax=Psilocybe cubensis TaxID=181762 RepID=A0ACB8GHX8_PSICU|nr:hypothetical protein JR316_0013271 [Psilocybe cubensis]KAH9474806.1 hypothetical protein JR316_0013271 [Psilocybe cubensis]